MQTMDFEQVKQARDALAGVTRNTTLMNARALTGNNHVFIKCENLQYTGSFKLRGAYNKMCNLSQEQKAKGVVAASAGNHAQGVAFSAQRMGIAATIVMPQGAPLSKVEATRSYGVEVILNGATFDDAYKFARELQTQRGAVFVHPFDDPLVIAGQGTIGMEIIEECPDVDVVLVAIGGGGLASGVALAVKSLKPSCKVYGVQAANAPSMLNSYYKNELVTLSSVATLADGIAVKRPGELTFDLCRTYLDGIVSVTEDEIAGAILSLIEKQKIIAEGAGAVPIAAAMYDKLDLSGKKVVCILSGGNIDVNFLSRIIDRGLVKSGRMVVITTNVPDKPGHLNKLLGIISDSGANIISIAHERTAHNVPIGYCHVEITMETADEVHKDRVFAEMFRNHYDFTVIT